MAIRLIRSSVFGLLLFTVVLSLSAPSSAQIGVGISVHFGPPALPVYEQPICPGAGYIWTPGYWAWDADASDYYWVPGTWVLAPQVGFLWTPPWWGWSGGAYLFHAGWWGPHIGFYGGINYGFGYFGVGFAGGEWRGGQFFYNRSVSNINVTNIHNVYNKTVVNNTTINRVSYNGGEGGLNARPTSEEERAEHEQHVGPVAMQTQHEESARSDPQQRASLNHGKPSVAATDRPGEMHGSGAVGAREAGAPYHAPEERGNEARGSEEAGRPENNVPRPSNATHAGEVSPHERMAAPNTGDAKQDQKFQKQQDKLAAQQQKEHQKLQQQQEKEHQQAAKRNADEASRQQMEQRHQQQTQAMEQRHAQQSQQMQERVQRASRPPKR